MAEISITELVKEYPNGFQAIRGVDLELGDGEFMVLVGPSGCGKSTLLRSVAGLEDVTSGTIRIGDRDVTHAAPRERDIAMVFQSYALYPHMSVARNIGYPLKLAGMPKSEIEARGAAVGTRLELTDELDRKPSQLSGGQRQRVAMGRAIVREPTAFLMDEPLSNLDAKLRVQMRAEIASIQKDLGITTLYVTHDQIEAMTMGDRVAVLNHGEIEQCASPRDLYDTPTNVFVAQFIGSPQINLFDATLASQNGQTVAMLGTETIYLPDQVRQNLDKQRGADSVVLGVRAEALIPATKDKADLTLEALFIEELGSEAMVHGTLVGDSTTRCVARRAAGQPLTAGDTLSLRLDRDKLHFFDQTTGNRITIEHE